MVPVKATSPHSQAIAPPQAVTSPPIVTILCPSQAIFHPVEATSPHHEWIMHLLEAMTVHTASSPLISFSFFHLPRPCLQALASCLQLPWQCFHLPRPFPHLSTPFHHSSFHFPLPCPSVFVRGPLFSVFSVCSVGFYFHSKH